tara:strand:+ start:923 stop:2251 length:1329 start_codon:yes stop_codon:yes gene_type:complete
MAVDFGRKIKEYRDTQKNSFLQDYWTNATTSYGNLSGKILWDNDNNRAVYNQPTQSMPNLASMWSQYAKGSKSRGITPDFITFKKYYDTLSAKRKQGFVTKLQTAQLSGVPIDKLHDMIRANPGLAEDLTDVVNSATDPNVKAELAGFMPQQQKTAGQVMAENQGLIGGAIGLGGIGAAYGLTPDAKKLDDAKSMLDKAKRDYKTGIKNIESETKAFNKNNKRPVKPAGSEPNPKRYKTKANYNKAKAKWDAEQLKYKSDIKNYNADKKSFLKDSQKQRSELSIEKRKAKIDHMKASRTRLGSFMKGKFGGKPSMAGGIGVTAAWMGAPMITSSVAKSMGFDENTQAQVANLTSNTIAGGYGANQLIKVMKPVASTVKAGGGIPGVMKALAGKPKNILGFGLAVASILLSSSGTGSVNTYSAPTVQPSSGTKKVKDYYNPFD